MVPETVMAQLTGDACDACRGGAGLRPGRAVAEPRPSLLAQAVRGSPFAGPSVRRQARRCAQGPRQPAYGVAVTARHPQACGAPARCVARLFCHSQGAGSAGPPPFCPPPCRGRPPFAYYLASAPLRPTAWPPRALRCLRCGPCRFCLPPLRSGYIFAGSATPGPAIGRPMAGGGGRMVGQQ